MSCLTLYSGQDSSCQIYARKYYQQVVLVNKSDVLSHEISSTSTKNRIRFILGEGKKGVLFRGNETGVNFQASFEMKRENNIPQYTHIVQLPIFGANEDTKIVLKNLDNSQYFAAIQFMDGSVEVYGFENGLITDDYEYTVAENGGSVINLISHESGLEDDIPYIYTPLTGNATDDFDNLFADITDEVLGSFNNDFNNDFDIT